MLRAEAHAGRDWTQRTASSPYAAWLAIVEALVGHRGLEESGRIAVAAYEDLPVDDRWRAVAAWLGGMSSYLSDDEEGSIHLILEAERLGRALDVPQIEMDALVWQAMLRFLAGNIPGACAMLATVADLMHRHAIDKVSTSAHALSAIALAQAVTRDPAAPTTLATARRRTEEIVGIAPWFQVTGRLVQARTSVALGDGALARQLLTEARARITPDLRSSIVHRLFDDVETSMRSMVSNGGSHAALTSAELRVLQFLPSHLTFPQIGQHLFLSGNTVKTHAMSIYRKLGVRSRADAVARAESLGLVEPPLLG
jgi:LuxR family maltose regulon positive regulatory protein